MSEPVTLDMIGRLAVRFVRAEEALQAADPDRDRERELTDARGTWEDLNLAVQAYGRKVKAT